MESKPKQGLTVLLLTLVIIIPVIIWNAAQNNVQLLGDKTGRALFKSAATSFQTAVNVVHALWFASGGAASTKTVILPDGEIVGVTPMGWPVNGVFGTSEGSVNGCVQVWNAIENRNLAMASLAAGKMFTASYQAPICVYRFNQHPEYRISYNIRTGSVATVVTLHPV